MVGKDALTASFGTSSRQKAWVHYMYTSDIPARVAFREGIDGDMVGKDISDQMQLLCLPFQDLTCAHQLTASVYARTDSRSLAQHPWAVLHAFTA